MASTIPQIPSDPLAGPSGHAERPATTSPIALARPGVPSVAGRTTKALGTFCSILITGPAFLDTAQSILTAELEAIDLACSRFRGDSELSALNRAGGRPMRVSPLLAAAVAAALRAAEVTAGDVDPTCGYSLVRLGYDRDFAQLDEDTSAISEPPAPAPGWKCVEFDPGTRTVRVPDGVMLDFGATAKALAADRAADAIWRRLGCGVLVNLGGDIAVAGQAPEGGWKVGVDDGVAEADAKQVVAVDSGAVATSSPAVRQWRRGERSMHHILVPDTGQPAEIYWKAVSVAAATCVDANTASTASIIRGRRAVPWLESLRLPARLVTPDGVVATTAGWPR